MAKILSIASTEMLKKTRHLILETAGHNVISFTSMPVISDIENSGKPDLAVVGHGFPGHSKRMIALALNQQFPGLPILEMCMNSPEIPGADFILSHSPEHLVIAVRDVLAGRRVRGFPV